MESKEVNDPGALTRTNLERAFQEMTKHDEVLRKNAVDDRRALLQMLDIDPKEIGL